MQIPIKRSAGVMSRMQWRGEALLSRCGCARAANWPRQVIPLFRIIGYDGRTRGNRELKRVLLAVGTLWRKRRNEQPVKPLKAHDSAKSRDFALNDFKGLPFRFVSRGEIFASFGAIAAWRYFARKETS
jgi:hypothetical protein